MQAMSFLKLSVKNEAFYVGTLQENQIYLQRWMVLGRKRCVLLRMGQQLVQR